MGVCHFHTESLISFGKEILKNLKSRTRKSLFCEVQSRCRFSCFEENNQILPSQVHRQFNLDKMTVISLIISNDDDIQDDVFNQYYIATRLRTQTFYFYSLDTGDDESGDGDDGDDDEQQNGKR